MYYREPITQFLTQRKGRIYIPTNRRIFELVSEMADDIGIENKSFPYTLDSLKSGKEIVLFPNAPPFIAGKKYMPNSQSTSITLMGARAADIPRLVQEESATTKAIGITGDDLFDEYKLICESKKDNSPDAISVLNTYDWVEENTRFGRPTLCLITKKNTPPRYILDSKPKICIREDYALTTNRALQTLLGPKSFTSYVKNSDVEKEVASGSADACVDIVLSGSTLDKLGLEVFSPIRTSDLVVIGPNPNYLGMQMAQDYERIAKRQRNPKVGSYTNEMLSDRKRVRNKLISEAAEVFAELDALKKGTSTAKASGISGELSDLVYAINLAMVAYDVNPQDVARKLYLSQ